MLCVKCGNTINEGDAFCTKCGTPIANGEVETSTTEEKSNEAVNTNNASLEPVILEPVIEEKSNEVVNTDNASLEPTIEKEEGERLEESIKENSSTNKDGNKSAKVGGIIFAVILGIGIIAWIILTLSLNASVKEKNSLKEEVIPTPSVPSESPKPSTIPSNNKKKISYAGYHFLYPSDFQAEDKNENGLLFKNDDVAFNVLVDYTHSFEDYEQYAINTYGEENVNESHEMISGNDYIFFYQQNLDTLQYVYVYITESIDDNVFIGLFSKIDHSAADIDDVTIIDDILSFSSVDYNFNKEEDDDDDDDDYGHDEIHFPEFDFNFFDEPI